MYSYFNISHPVYRLLCVSINVDGLTLYISTAIIRTGNAKPVNLHITDSN